MSLIKGNDPVPSSTNPELHFTIHLQDQQQIKDAEIETR